LNTKRFVVIQNNFVRSQRREDSAHTVKLNEVRKLYKRNDGVIVASQGIKDDLQQELGLKDVPIHVIWNAAITMHNFERAREPVDHRWLQNNRETPVIINVARLAPQKDLKTLIDAVSIVRQKRKCRLAILGKGPLRDELMEHARKRGLENDFDLPGFVDNPYAWMARADCFALSSIWEGFGIVLAEALSLGLPVVSTDCPSGPREILQDGRYGKLVPMQDSHALAEAIERTLNGDVEEFDPTEAVKRFTAEYASRRYLEAFGFLEIDGTK
jgi:glycosyltransferase involved in cell wall biosynthesis